MVNEIPNSAYMIFQRFRERQQVIQWLKQKQEWNLEELISELLGFSGFPGLACGWCQD